MVGLPEVTIIGTLTADVQLKFVPSGDAVAEFTVASNERRFNKQSGQYEDGAATFVRCSLWRQPAENLAQSVGRGDRVFVLGRLKQREFEKDGQKRTVFELDVDEVGPTTRFATTRVNKVSRSGNSSGSSGGSGGGWSSAPAPQSAPDDPWGAAPPAGGGGAMDPTEPPFDR